jgi:hypothetical protein
MPAIQLSRLKIQVDELLDYFVEPYDFIRQLHVLFGFYADRTRRPGQSGKPKSLVKSYQISQQVMRRISSDIENYVIEDPENAIILAESLWRDGWFESRLVAISILGLLPIRHIDTVVMYMKEWGKDCRDDALLESLLKDGARKIISEVPDKFLPIVEEWLTDEETTIQKLGLRGLSSLVNNPKFDNLPIVYRFLSPMIKQTTSSLESDLLLVVRSLAHRSPLETAYFLKQSLSAPHKLGLGVIIRGSIDVFPPDVQDSLRVGLREQMRTK